MTRHAWAFISCVLVGGAVLSVRAYLVENQYQNSWFVFVVLTALAIVSQLYEAQPPSTPGQPSYYPHLVFFFVGVLLLPPFLFVGLVTIPHLVELIYKRYIRSNTLSAWYIQPFNIATHIIAGSVAGWLYTSFEADLGLFKTGARVLFVMVVAFIYVAINHLFIAFALLLARGVGLRQSGLLGMVSILPDFILTYLGYVLAILWVIDPWLIVPALSPVVIINEALKVPQLKQEAQTDTKTGLLNVRHFNRTFASELERARRYKRPLALIMADLDYFRNVNNNFGHQAGDIILTAIGKIIQSNLREYDSAGRFGGEEFTILVPETGEKEASALAERIRLEIQSTRFALPGVPSPIQVTMSFGIATFPVAGSETAGLLEAADKAVYQAKHLGRNQVVCSSELERHSSLPPKLFSTYNSAMSRIGDATPPESEPEYPFSLDELYLALARNEFELYYQPLISLRTGQLQGVEALIRWHHPERGLVMPAQFIPQAEKSGLVLALGQWVMEEACRQAQRWSSLPNRPPLLISVNVSPHQLQSLNFVETIEKLLRYYNLDPACLQIEVTEGVDIEQLDRVSETLQALKKLGVKLALDDFGTGYASLSYLQQFHIDTLKIPRTFVKELNQNPANRAVVEALINLGHSLNLSIIGEGVETLSELELLKQLGCDFAQGYYFARPLTRQVLEIEVESYGYGLEPSRNKQQAG